MQTLEQHGFSKKTPTKLIKKALASDDKEIIQLLKKLGFSKEVSSRDQPTQKMPKNDVIKDAVRNFEEIPQNNFNELLKEFSHSWNNARFSYSTVRPKELPDLNRILIQMKAMQSNLNKEQRDYLKICQDCVKRLENKYL